MVKYVVAFMVFDVGVLISGRMIELRSSSVAWRRISISMSVIMMKILSRRVSLYVDIVALRLCLESYMYFYLFLRSPLFLFFVQIMLSGLQMSNFTKEEFVHILRRQSTGFSRGSSKYRGVTLHKCGRWEARMGQLLGKK